MENDKATEAALEGRKYTHILDTPYRWESWAAPKNKEGQIDHNTALTGDDLIAFVNGKLFPFSSTKSKDYPAEAWAKALKLLNHERAEAPLHLAAGLNQADRLQDFARTLHSAGITNIHLAPPVPLPDFLQSIAEARLVLTVDTAAAHMACALDTSAVIVSAGQHPRVYAPYSKNGRQKWLLPPPGLSKNEWRQHFTPEMVADCVRSVFWFFATFSGKQGFLACQR